MGRIEERVRFSKAAQPVLLQSLSPAMGTERRRAALLLATHRFFQVRFWRRRSRSLRVLSRLLWLGSGPAQRRTARHRMRRWFLYEAVPEHEVRQGRRG